MSCQLPADAGGITATSTRNNTTREGMRLTTRLARFSHSARRTPKQIQEKLAGAPLTKMVIGPAWIRQRPHKAQIKNAKKHALILHLDGIRSHAVGNIK